MAQRSSQALRRAHGLLALRQAHALGQASAPQAASPVLASSLLPSQLLAPRGAPSGSAGPLLARSPLPLVRTSPPATPELRSLDAAPRFHLRAPPSLGGAALAAESARQRQQGQQHSCAWGVSSAALASAVAAVAAAAGSTASAKQAPLKPAPQDVVLYQYEACPFCNKVKAFLDYYGVAYRVVEVNPLTRKEIKWSQDYKKVPILVVDGEPMNDSSAIITTLQDRLNPEEGSKGRKTPQQLEEEAKWRKWVDEHLVHLLSPNIYRNPTEALEAFDYITVNGNFGALERAAARYVGATTMYFIGKKLKKKHKIEDERESLYSALNEWQAALGGRKFMGGEKPNLADLAVFGVLRPIRSMQTGRDMMEKTHIATWYNAMESEVGASARLPEAS